MIGWPKCTDTISIVKIVSDRKTTLANENVSYTLFVLNFIHSSRIFT